jgi:hypothetical protein
MNPNISPAQRLAERRARAAGRARIGRREPSPWSKGDPLRSVSAEVKAASEAWCARRGIPLPLEYYRLVASAEVAEREDA